MKSLCPAYFIEGQWSCSITTTLLKWLHYWI